MVLGQFSRADDPIGASLRGDLFIHETFDLRLPVWHA